MVKWGAPASKISVSSSYERDMPRDYRMFGLEGPPTCWTANGWALACRLVVFS